MRGIILYEQGLRPLFKKALGFWDEDDFDYHSYHILAKHHDRIVGCIRLLPIVHHLDCVSREIVGPKTFETVLNHLPFKQHKLSEGNRWLVHPDYRDTMVGHSLLYALWALANHLDLQFIGNGGFKTKALIRHYGGTLLEKYAGPYYSEKYNDQVYLFYFDVNLLSARARRQIYCMSMLLGLKQPDYAI